MRERRPNNLEQKASSETVHLSVHCFRYGQLLGIISWIGVTLTINYFNFSKNFSRVWEGKKRNSEKLHFCFYVFHRVNRNFKSAIMLEKSIVLDAYILWPFLCETNL